MASDCCQIEFFPWGARSWADVMSGVAEPVGTVRACPRCGRSWVVYLSTSPISAWAFRAWRRERWWERRRRTRRERRIANGG